ncbi:hydroxyacylglutathione hydrolase [Methylocystis sp. WRRC1]|uniref:hydroxyacylglutathione hydrolase n=1 Tax=Methylocystis sp. WRRC1 TaxID=1732014 RepID=UPI001D15000E|nr:hydroxyacylglutathione hydrolase [Methylocystis sp. WRRC1]MCC3245371.1 hydroxyacylglutathione hydrolase [Methylocystis sp. WRRC1]
MPIEVVQFTCLTDNFGLLVHDVATGATASVDAPDGAAIAAEAERRGWPLTHLLLTHHHLDHIEGAEALKKRFPQMKIVGAKKDAHRLPPLDIAVGDGDVVMLGASRARVIETPGHTLGHVAYHFADDDAVFVGDTLFSLGCGRVFEGTMEQMRLSLETLANLPGETRIYCGHEYTQANAKFALTVDPENPVLLDRANSVNELRAAGKFTLPSTIALENATNPFLRVEDPLVKKAMGMDDANPFAVFAEMRERKNRFVA